MTTPTAVLLGAVFGLGLVGLIRGIVGVEVDDDAPPRPSPTAVLRERFDRLGLRCAAAATGAVSVALLTWWPVGILLAAAGGFAAPSLLGGRARREAAEARLDAIASWTEQLRDVMAAATGLEQAIIATAPHAPTAIRSDVAVLVITLESGTSMRTALRRFADRLDDPAGDLVVASLILAAEGSPRQLGDLLGRLATTARDTVKMRLRIDAGRARTRSSVTVVTAVTVVFSAGIVVLNPTYVETYRSPLGQVVLSVVVALFSGSYWWLARSSQTRTTGRFLHAGHANLTPAVAGKAGLVR